MDKKIYLLHYPDGQVSANLVKGKRPDAFLFAGRWIVFKMRFERTNYQQALEFVSSIRISKQLCSGRPCELLTVTDLKEFLNNLTAINELRVNCGFPEIPKTEYFWAIQRSEKERRSLGVCLKLERYGIKAVLSGDGISPMSFAIACVPKSKALACN